MDGWMGGVVSDIFLHEGSCGVCGDAGGQRSMDVLAGE